MFSSNRRLSFGIVQASPDDSSDSAGDAAKSAANSVEGMISDLGPRIEQANIWISENGSEFSLALSVWFGVFLGL